MTEITRDDGAYLTIGQAFGTKVASDPLDLHVGPQLLDITNTSTRKVSFRVYAVPDSAIVGATGNEFWTGATFMKLGAT